MPVTDIAILDSGSTPYIYPPAGYYRVPVDLNQGVGGDYIFLAYLIGNAAQPITGLYVSSQGGPGAQPPAGYVTASPETDLNKGVGGRYLYLCYTTDPAVGQPITNLNVVAGSSKNPPVPDGWSIVNADLNEGAGGAYIYLIYTTT